MTRPATLNARRLSRLRAGIVTWADESRRDLPWRRTRDPWAVLVSEVMLAQTQVVRVIPRWEAFMACWPTPTACARAPLADLISAWTGLGYNRRAVFLHRTAVQLVERHGGMVPADARALLALPGVGSYTARAVLAFAFDRPVGVIDTNAARVLARAVAGRRLAPAEAQQLADRLVPPRTSWAWNQAMLDLGATVCTARQPSCRSCPLGPRSPRTATGRPVCAWAAAGGPDPASGSAGTSRPQSKFAGSDRQGRGRLLAHLAAAAVVGSGEVRPADLAAAAGWPGDPNRALAAARSLVADGLAVAGPDGTLRLP